MTPTLSPEPVSDPPRSIAPSTPPPRRGLRVWTSRLQWVVVPLLGLLVANAWVIRIAPPRWYSRTVAEAKTGDAPRYLFVGSSRVGAAVDAQHFVRQLAGPGQTSPMAVNLGMGYSTPAQHYLGVRSLIEHTGPRFAGTVVFIESPCGLPNLSTWKAGWASNDQIQLLDGLIEPEDLPRLMVSETRWPSKIQAAWMSLTGPIKVLNRPHVTGDWVKRICTERLPEKILGPAPEVEPQADLVNAAGIRTDAETVERARRAAVTSTQRRIDNEQPLPVESDEVVLFDLIEMVEAAGGRVVLFVPPFSEVQSRSYRTPLRRSEILKVRERLNQAGVQMLWPSFEYTDADLPDLWHLAASRRAEYTDALLRAYQQSGGRLSGVDLKR